MLESRPLSFRCAPRQCSGSCQALCPKIRCHLLHLIAHWHKLIAQRAGNRVAGGYAAQQCFTAAEGIQLLELMVLMHEAGKAAALPDGGPASWSSLGPPAWAKGRAHCAPPTGRRPPTLPAACLCNGLNLSLGAAPLTATASAQAAPGPLLGCCVATGWQASCQLRTAWVKPFPGSCGYGGWLPGWIPHSQSALRP